MLGAGRAARGRGAPPPGSATSAPRRTEPGAGVAGPDASPQALARLVKALAGELGFDLVRIASAEPLASDGRIAVERVQAGLMDGLPWFTEDRARLAADPQRLLPGARSIVSLGVSYLDDRPATASAPGRGIVSRYARGRDYHSVIRRKLRLLLERLREQRGSGVQGRIFVDTGPLLERASARRAGLGWFGKNTMILTPSHGSWVFLAQIVTDAALEPDQPLRKTCGACQRCLDVCPTGALTPYALDNRRCISYLTIENRGAIPRELRAPLGLRIFGCDDCQEVCPVNLKARPGREPSFRPQDAFTSAPPLVELLEMDEAGFAARFAGSAVRRAKLWGLQRNACVALGNLKEPAAVGPLADTLDRNGSAIVRAHAAWALGRIGGPTAGRALRRAAEDDGDAAVREEARAALAAGSSQESELRD